jgi:hypothetical protein
MAKPILQLGLGEEQDTEFDPLLGRAVREKPDAAHAPRSNRLNLDQSVFDDVDIPEALASDDSEHRQLKARAKARTRSGAEAVAPEPAAQKPNAFDEPEVAHDTKTDIEGAELGDATVPAEEMEGTFEGTGPRRAFVPQFGSGFEVASTQESVAGEPLWRSVPRLFKAGGTFEALKIGRQSERERSARPVQAPKRSALAQRHAIQTLAATLVGFGLFHASLFATFFSFAAPLGYPYDLVSSYRGYWTLMALISFGAWAVLRSRSMMVLSGLVVALNLIVIMPSLGQSPKGGKVTGTILAWANVKGSTQGLEELLEQSQKREVTMIMIGEPPKTVLTPPAGWTLLEKPDFADPTSLAVLAKSTWKSKTTPGEPTMLQNLNMDLTVIGVRPQPPHNAKTNRVTREAQLNRAAIRAGDQAGPIAVVGDFSAVPWDGAMGRFRHYGNIDRVQCGGLLGTTLLQGYGFVGVTYDHVYIRDIKVTKCILGSALSDGNHRPIFLSVTPRTDAR